MVSWTTAKLVGFAGEWGGGEMALVRRLPVISYQHRVSVATRLAWTLTDGIRCLGRGEQQDIEVLPRTSKIREGDSVWLAGPDLVRACRTNRLLDGARDLFAGWAHFLDGFVYGTGSNESFHQFALTLYRVSKLALARGLARADHATLETCFDVFDSTGVFDEGGERAHLAMCGLYYRSTHDIDRYERTQSQAVAGGLFPDAESFDAETERLREFHLMGRQDAFDDGAVTGGRGPIILEARFCQPRWQRPHRFQQRDRGPVRAALRLASVFPIAMPDVSNETSQAQDGTRRSPIQYLRERVQSRS